MRSDARDRNAIVEGRWWRSTRARVWRPNYNRGTQKSNLPKWEVLEGSMRKAGVLS